MALAFMWQRQNLWPFSGLHSDDLRVSYELVHKLPISEDTKKFVFALHEPETQSVIYILSVKSFSEWSAWDAEHLIREIRPDAVIVKGVGSTVKAMKTVEEMLGVENPVPTSTFEVLKRCFKEKVDANSYQVVATWLVVQEIFGAGSNGHFLAAKRAAQEAGLSFMVLESPLVLAYSNTTSSIADGELNVVSIFQDLCSSLVPRNVQCKWSSVSDVGSNVKEIDQAAQCTYEVPQFAQSVHSFLVKLHDVHVDDTPSMRSALAHARTIFDHVSRGEAVDAQVVSQVYPFRKVMEGLRIRANDAGQLPIYRKNPILNKSEFSKLASEDKSHALSAEALRSLTKKFKTIVAIVDVKDLPGLRKYWYTPIPPEHKEWVAQIVTHYEGDEAAGAISEGSSFSELVRASIIMNVKVKLKIPTTSDYVIRAAQNTALWAVRTASYEVMRTKKAKLGPMGRFMVSVGIHTGLLKHKAGIKCAAESLPAAPSVARLGRGIKSLSHASQVVKDIQESLGFSRRA